MKKCFLLLILCLISVTSYAQFVAKMEITDNIEGLCDRDNVVHLFPTLDGQEVAICPVSKEVILNLLNSEVQFIKDNPKYKDKGMISLIINCNGDVVQCKMDNKTDSELLDKELENIFNSLGDWTPGKLYGASVDSSILFSFKIKKGTFQWD